MARGLLRPPAANLMAIGGLSGSGKSTLARALAPAIGPVPGALVLRSDEVRKRLHGASPLERLGADAYGPGTSERVYQALGDSARIALAAGHAVVVDAVFLRNDERRAIEAVAAALSVPFTGFWLDAPGPTLVDRVRTRQADASDADADVVRKQLALAPQEIDWPRLDAGVDRDALVRQARAAAGIR
jgi:hypothetical protein